MKRRAALLILPLFLAAAIRPLPSVELAADLDRRIGGNDL